MKPHQKISGTFIYTAELIDLHPNSTYYYRVSSDEFNKREVMNFKTFPNDITKLKFIVMADSQETEYDYGIRFLIDKISEINIDFYIHLGDVVERGYEQDEWNMYFKEFEKITAYKVGFYVEGNHDTKKDSSLMYDNIPMRGSSCSFSFDKLLFLLKLNTNSITSEHFIEEELNKTKEIWKIPIMHKPIFNTYIERDNDEFKPLLNWLKYFRVYDVDIVFWGHSHAYECQFVNDSYYILCPTIGIHGRSESNFQLKDFT